MRRVASIAVAGLALLVAALPGPVGAVSDLRPDLQPLPASDLSIVQDSSGEVWLRFATLSWNHGTGPLTLFVKTEEQPEDGKQKVYQRIATDDGGSRERLAGEFVFHAEHGHFHFEGYADYLLLDSDNNGRSAGSKTSFCLIDTDRIDHRLPGAPKRAVYTQCDATEQGISVGWGDTYGAHLPGQELNVTGLSPGEYRLVIDVDPQNRLLEADEAESNGAITTVSVDNTSELRIYLDAASGVVEVLSGDESGGGGPGNGNGRGGGPPQR